MMDGESPLVQWRCGDGRKMIKGTGKLGQAEKRKEAVDGTATVDGSVRKFANCLVPEYIPLSKNSAQVSEVWCLETKSFRGATKRSDLVRGSDSGDFAQLQ